ncbi:DUF4123 domain-containing protein [Consotaella aegiceratis]|uniref:DUF4123 domain-containing protein n=1 Tax=Consotaella aegiceratis TaxID=3097961 RepID=UPI002F41F9C7
MEISTDETPDTEIATCGFHAALDTMPSPLFAVLDGGHFDDLKDELADVGIASRSLFLEVGDDDMRRDGPRLVALEDRKTRKHIEELVLKKPCAVIWSCPDGENALWRHLRTINEVWIPDERFSSNERHSNKPVKYERVLFRHWDPNALAVILPLLDTQQLAHLFGPAQAIFIKADRLARAKRPDNLPKAQRGMLTIRGDQLEAVETHSRASYCSRMAAHLRAMAPQETAAMSEQELNERILRYEASGNGLGLTQERSLSIWGFLMLASGDRFEHQPEIREFLWSGPGTPDENVEALLHQMTRLANTIEEVS